MPVLHGIFTLAFSLVYCDKFSYEKPSLNLKSVPNLNFVWIFLVLGNVHEHGSLSHFLTLVGWQVWIKGVQIWCGDQLGKLQIVGINAKKAALSV